MKKITFLTALLLISIQSNAQLEPIFEPSLSIEPYLVVDSPDNETVVQVIDGDVATKFLDFEETDGSGFTVDLGGTSRIASVIDITTANDAELRDPTIVEISGSTDGTNFDLIASIDIECIVERFETRQFAFANTEAFSFYRINFIQECDDIEGIIQVAEVQLFEDTLSVGDIDKLENQISIFPNPSEGDFSVSTKNAIDALAIYDITGKLVYQKTGVGTVNDVNISLQKSLDAGIYMVAITTQRITTTKRLIIK